MRLFVAAWPDATTRDELAGLPLGSAPGLRPTGAATWHVTLRFLGPVEEPMVPGLVAALTGAARTSPVPTGQVGPATAWLGDGRVLYLPVTGLDALAAAVRRATSGAPARPGSDRPFHGHITVARATRRPLGPAARARLGGIPFRSEFTVDAVDLVASAMSADGPRYTSLGRVPLGRVTSTGHRSRSVPSSRPEPRVDPRARPRRPGEPDVERPEESGPP